MEHAIGVLGIGVLLLLAWLASTNRRIIGWGPILVALALQGGIALIALRTGLGAWLFDLATDLAVAFIGYADEGIAFMFGRWPEEVLGSGGEPLRLPFVFAVRVLPILIFMASVFSILYHLGILQRVVNLLARGLRWAMRISGAESLATIGNIFLGMTESPLLVRPYVAAMTRSELFCVMTAGLATVAGTVLVAYIGILGGELAGHLIAASFMSAPAAVAIAKIIVPEEGKPQTLGGARLHVDRGSANLIDAAASGAAEGLHLALNVGAMLIAFVALIYMLDDGVEWLGGLVGHPDLSFAGILGLALAPLAWLLGVPWSDAQIIGQMLGVKTIFNEFLAYQMLAEASATLDPRSVVIASYALCGFANFGSLAILLGGLGGIAPERRPDIARDGIRAIYAGSIATFLTGAIAGLLL
jgi:CNT family concentrative nucleoside transporter